MWRLAWRNLWRNRTRSFITGSAIALTFALMLMTFGIQESEYLKMEQAAVRTAGGSILVHAEGYWEDPSTERVMEASSVDLEKMAEVEGVVAVLPRVIIQGLVSSPRGNAGVQLKGIAPEGEAQIRDLSKHVRGSFLKGKTSRGRPPIVLGAGVAKKLKLDLGDKVVLTCTDTRGEMQRALFQLQGILETGSAMVDDIAAYTTIAHAQEALGAGEILTQVGVLVESDSERYGIKAGLQGVLPTSGLEVLTWDEAIPEMTSFIEIDRRMGTIIMYVLVVIVTFGIMNTFMMVILERIRELGLLAAIGMAPRQVAALMVAETFWLAVVSMSVGAVLGYLAHLYFAAVGLDLSSTMGESMELNSVLMDDMVMRSHLDWGRWLGGTVGVLLLVMASGLYPAWRASRLMPTEAMRTYE
ncbi:MAG: FtsX-like permease family protein [Myxococcota bacterium]|nr:FtsX-like permease family protein [Myxococcota bacterium]